MVYNAPAEWAVACIGLRKAQRGLIDVQVRAEVAERLRSARRAKAEQIGGIGLGGHAGGRRHPRLAKNGIDASSFEVVRPSRPMPDAAER